MTDLSTLYRTNIPLIFCTLLQHEWLTMNYPPHHWPGKQEGLFGGGG